MLNGEEVDEVDEDDEDDTPLSELVLGLLTAERACRRHWTCGTACSSGARKAPAPASLPSVATSANERGRRKSTESPRVAMSGCACAVCGFGSPERARRDFGRVGRLLRARALARRALSSPPTWRHCQPFEADCSRRFDWRPAVARLAIALASPVARQWESTARPHFYELLALRDQCHRSIGARAAYCRVRREL